MNLELAILNVLAASPRALSVKVLRGFVPSFTGSDHTLTDLTRTLQRLESKGHVRGTGTGECDEDNTPVIVWKETADGRLRI